MAILRFVVQLVASLGLTVLVQVLWRRRLTPERKARGWNAASWGAAVYAFGPLSLIPFAWVTRARDDWPGRIGALVWGALFCALVVGAATLVDEAFAAFVSDDPIFR